MLGGEIWIESELNAGTKVFFTAAFDLSYDEISRPLPPLVGLLS